MTGAANRRATLLVGVRFGPSGRVRYFDPGDLDLEVGDRVVVESEGEPRDATVVIAPDQVIYSEVRGELEPVVRKIQADGDQ